MTPLNGPRRHAKYIVNRKVTLQIVENEFSLICTQCTLIISFLQLPSATLPINENNCTHCLIHKHNQLDTRILDSGTPCVQSMSTDKLLWQSTIQMLESTWHSNQLRCD
jgi:hypothetical protein